jgi:hypothetical protein
MAAYSRRSEGKIGVLKEVIRRVQNGEVIDVEGILGTGDRKQEEEWFDGMIYHSVLLSWKIGLLISA